MIQPRVIGYVLLMAMAVTGYGFSAHRVQAIRNEIPQEEMRAKALMVNPKLLTIVSGEFKGLMADYLLLKASVFLGGAWEMTDEDWKAIALMYKQSLALDPLFFQTGYYIQGTLSWRKGMHAQAVELLLDHAAHRYWDWEPRFYVGVDYFHYLKDTEKAAYHLKKSAALSGAPTIVGTLAARLLHRSSQTVAAIAMLKAMIEMTDDDLGKKALFKRLEAYQGIQKIDTAIAQYKDRFARLPGSLEDLTATGILEKMPANPFGDTYLYMPDSGRVYFDTLHSN